jgi:predicted O-methyltransferase YrrM
MAMQETPFGSMNYNVLANLLKSLNIVQYGAAAEVGVLYGDTSFHLLNEIPHLNLYPIDPYLPYDEPDRTLLHMTKFESDAKRKLSIFGSRSILMKQTSVDAAPAITDASLDFVFIDAQHTYEAMKEDIATWVPKVRQGGLITGHDYRWDGVNRAVNEFAAESGYNGHYPPSRAMSGSSLRDSVEISNNIPDYISLC